MLVPLQVTFRRISSNEAIRERIHHHVAKLESVFARITGCHVTIDAPHRHHRHGNHFSVRVDIQVPGRRLIVAHDPAQCHARADLFSAIDDAFGDSVRILEQYAERVRAFEPERIAS